MTNKILKNNKESTRIAKRGGFTLIETMVAVFVLTIALSSLLTLTANSIFSARYARNEITANYLLQEAADYIRSDRDNTVFKQNIGGPGWNIFIDKYGRATSSKCFSASGCYLEPSDIASVPTGCPAGAGNTCPNLNYDETATNTSNDFYTYKSGAGIVPSIFNRKILMTLVGADELNATITMDWTNGNLARTRSLKVILLNWQKSN